MYGLRILVLLALLAGAGAGARRAVEEKAAAMSTTTGTTATKASTYGINPSKGPAGTTATTGTDVLVAGTTAITCGGNLKSKVPAAVASMATSIALYYRGPQYPVSCCQPIVAFVDLAGLCGVASQPQLILARLDFSRFLALYTACRSHRPVLTAARPGETTTSNVDALVDNNSTLSTGGFFMFRLTTNSCVAGDTSSSQQNQ